MNPASDGYSDAGGPAPVSKRRRILEACHACRKRKTKCNGSHPCASCLDSNTDCIYDAAAGTLGPSTLEQSIQRMNESLQTLTEKVTRIENFVHSAGSVSPLGLRVRLPVVSNVDKHPAANENMNYGEILASVGKGVSVVSGSPEYYGATSSLAIVTNLYDEQTGMEPDSPSKRENGQKNGSGQTPAARESQSVSEEYTPKKPLITFVDYQSIKPIADKHLDNCYHTTQILCPVLHQQAFRALYNNSQDCLEMDNLGSSDAERTRQTSIRTLIHSMLALGALHDSNTDRDIFWAREWFARARLGIDQAGDESSFELVLSLYLLASYAQYVLNPNLAYNLLGKAIRLAFSIGLNRSSVRVSYHQSAWAGVSSGVMEEIRRRLWWQMYTADVELALDTGRPLGIRESDFDVEWPIEVDDDAVSIDQMQFKKAPGPSRISFLIAISRFSTILRKVLKILYPVRRTKTTLDVITEALLGLDSEIREWQAQVPYFLRDWNGYRANDPPWISRQRGALFCHFNHIFIIMYRPLLAVRPFATPYLTSATINANAMSAAKANIGLIHLIFEEDKPLRSWFYYCYYNFMATLVLLIMLKTNPFSEEASDWATSCNLAIESFSWMAPMKAASKCQLLCQSFVDDWVNKIDRRRRGSDVVSEGKRSIQFPFLPTSRLDNRLPRVKLDTNNPSTGINAVKKGSRDLGASPATMLPSLPDITSFQDGVPTLSSMSSLPVQDKSDMGMFGVFEDDFDAAFNDSNFMGNMVLDWTQHFEFGVGNMGWNGMGNNNTNQ